MALPTFRNGDPRKDTPLYQIANWSKLDLLAEAIASNAFGTDSFAWIDFGLGYVARPPEAPFRPTQRVSILQMRAVAPAEVEDRLAFYQYERSRLAGAFFAGRRQRLLELREAFL